MTIEAPRILRSESPINELTYDHVRYVSEIHDSGHRCGEVDFVYEAWLSESASNVLNLVTSNATISECQGSELTYVDPIGALMIDDAAFVIAEESYYEGASTLILRLGPQSVAAVMRHHYSID